MYHLWNKCPTVGIATVLLQEKCDLLQWCDWSNLIYCKTTNYIFLLWPISQISVNWVVWPTHVGLFHFLTNTLPCTWICRPYFEVFIHGFKVQRVLIKRFSFQKLSRLVVSRFLDLRGNLGIVKEKPTKKTCFSREKKHLAPCIYLAKLCQVAFLWSQRNLYYIFTRNRS